MNYILIFIIGVAAAIWGVAVKNHIRGRAQSSPIPKSGLLSLEAMADVREEAHRARQPGSPDTTPRLEWMLSQIRMFRFHDSGLNDMAGSQAIEVWAPGGTLAERDMMVAKIFPANDRSKCEMGFPRRLHDAWVALGRPTSIDSKFED